MADSITNVLIPTQTRATRLFLGGSYDACAAAESVVFSFFWLRRTWECELKSYKPRRTVGQWQLRGGWCSHVTSQEHICWPGGRLAQLQNSNGLVVWSGHGCHTLCRILPHFARHTQSWIRFFLLFFLAIRQFVVTLLNYVFPVCLLKCNGACTSSHLGFLSVLSCTWPQVAQATHSLPNELGVKLSRAELVNRLCDYVSSSSLVRVSINKNNALNPQ